jgi:hypothetical protein
MHLTLLETDNKQIPRRGVYPEHGRRAPQNDIATQVSQRPVGLTEESGFNSRRD